MHDTLQKGEIAMYAKRTAEIGGAHKKRRKEEEEEEKRNPLGRLPEITSYDPYPIFVAVRRHGSKLKGTR